MNGRGPDGQAASCRWLRWVLPGVAALGAAGVAALGAAGVAALGG
jgi:hypothetical protein